MANEFARSEIGEAGENKSFKPQSDHLNSGRQEAYEKRQPSGQKAIASDNSEGGQKKVDLPAVEIVDNTDHQMYKSYFNDRFGIKVDYPSSLLIPQGEHNNDRNNGDGQEFRSPDGKVSMSVFGSHPDSGGIQAEHQNVLSHLLETKPQIIEDTVDKDSFVISGVANGKVFYQKTWQSSGDFKTFTARYPVEAKAQFDPITARMSQSLRSFQGTDE